MQAAFKFLKSAPVQLEVYRRQRRFRTDAYGLVTLMCRALLNAVMMLGRH